MVNVHFPGAGPVAARDCELRVRYRLGNGPRIKVRKGEQLSPERVVAERDPAAVAVRVPLADPLGAAPGQVSRCLARPIGSTVASGEVIAKHRRALRNLAVQAPVAGTLVGIDSGAGEALIAPAGAGELRALLPGEVETIEGKDTLVIRTVGTRILGIIGLGTPVGGPIRLAVSAADESLGLEGINSSLAGAIVVGGRSASAAAIRRLIEVGATGLIVGSLQHQDLTEAFGWRLEDRLAPWRVQVLGAGLVVPIALAATEGFGSIPMSQPVFDVLRELQGRQAVLLPATALHGNASRPQLVVADTDAVERDAPAPRLECVPGATARLGDQASLGQMVGVASQPRCQQLGDGVTEFVVEVELPGGSRRTVRAANLEIIG